MADVIPPPFANKMAHAVYPHLRSKLAEQKLKHQLKVVEQSDLTHRQAKKAVEQVNAGVFTMSAFVDALSLNGEAVREVELKQASTTSHNKPGTTMSETTKLQPLTVWDLKQHGKWEYWGDYYGWLSDGHEKSNRPPRAVGDEAIGVRLRVILPKRKIHGHSRLLITECTAGHQVS